MSPDDIAGRKSRSQKKRESTALQEYGREVSELSPSVRRALPLPDDLDEAFDALGAMKSREAKRRQMQYIGRLMREMDEDERAALLSALEALRQESRMDAAAHHRLEAMRDELLASDAEVRTHALRRVLEQCPHLDAGKLGHLVEAAVAERAKHAPPRQARMLFRYLRDSGADGS